MTPPSSPEPPLEQNLPKGSGILEPVTVRLTPPVSQGELNTAALDALHARQAAAAPAAAPEPFARGTFALFSRDDGAVVLAVRTGPDDEWTETIPAEMVTLARQFKDQMGGDHGPLGAFKALRMARKARKVLDA